MNPQDKQPGPPDGTLPGGLFPLTDHRRRSARDGRLARRPGRRDRPRRLAAGGLPVDAVEAPGVQSRRALRRRGHHALRQHDFRRSGARVPRRPPDRAAHQEHHPLECDGDGRAGEPAKPGHRRAHLDLRLGRHALRSGVQPLLARQRGPRAARPGVLSRTRGAGHLRPGVPAGPPHGRPLEELPPRVAGHRRGCPRIRIPG